MFTTPVHIPPVDAKIQLSSRILSVGSCFAQVIGNRLQENKFNTFINPFGTIYNPASLFQHILESVNQRMPGEETYLVNQGIHFNYKFHSDFAASSREDLEAMIEQAMNSTRQFLASTDWFIITLGTAFTYELAEGGLIVSNCHKMPAKTFQRRMLDTEEIVRHFEEMFVALEDYHPAIKYIFTVSPVRHTRDTLVQNSVSKAMLRVAAEQIRKKHEDKVYYFPSYEIMMDELRDYRFYKADMIHPSEVAEAYIWEKFVETYLDQEAFTFVKEWESLAKSLRHQAFRPESDAHQNFLKKTIARLRQLSNTIDVRQEIKHLEQQLL